MTSIDQALLGPVPAKTGKATAKAGDDTGSNGGKAFGDVFAKTAKKQDDHPGGKSSVAAGKEMTDGQFSSLKMPGPAKLAGHVKDVLGQMANAAQLDLSVEESNENTAKLANELRNFNMKTKTKADTGDETSNVATADVQVDTAAVATDVSKLMEMLSAASQTAITAKSRSASGETGEKSILAEFHELSPLMSKADQKKDAGTAARTVSAATEDVAADASEANDIFRFARADGKGKAMDMKLSALSDEARVSDRDAPKAKIENITVLESRRYLGLAANTNSNSGILTAAISGNSEWAAAMLPGSAPANASLADNTGKVVNTLKLQMHPIDLGSVTATLRLTGDALNVDLRVETSEAYRQLSDDQSGILKALRGQGFEVDQINVVLVQPDSSTKASQSADGAAQQQFNQSARDGAGNGPQQGQGRQDDNRQFAAGRGTRDDGTDEAMVAAGLQRGNPGHVYL